MPVAELVDMAGDQFLAGAGLANDQHAGITGGDLLQVRQQGPGRRIFKDLGGGAYGRGQCRGGRLC